MVGTLLHGCMGPSGATVVTGLTEPKQIRFVTVVKPDLEEGVGGWQVSCIHIRLTRSGTGESFLCRFGIEMPVRNREGPVSVPLAQRVASERINETAYSVLGSATPASPLGVLCETLKGALAPRIAGSIVGAMMTYRCHKDTVPVEFGDFVL
ncbi:hypothetical protein JY651_12910 [Pyxidicoccus parkwayensis]|uniref:Uncharacterized protein n=2 Tax=Pyxidicoccus parkwayensis TaxID=2813578 RepID=A0ABX7PCB0_9BACT|nr:hypothetical protein JY651_12910 [Pyxidicoccus parkwaysis]